MENNNIDKERNSDSIFNKKHFIRTGVILFFTAIIGGLGNYFYNSAGINFMDQPVHIQTKDFYSEEWFKILKAIIFGLVATTVVPIFLHFIHSDLLLIDKTPGSNIRNNVKVYVLIGFCVLTSFYSDAFVSKMYEKTIAKELKEAQENIKKTKRDSDLIFSNLIKINELKEDSLGTTNTKNKNFISKVDSVISEKNVEKGEAEILKHIIVNNGFIFEEDLYEKFNDSSSKVEKLVNDGQLVRIQISNKNVILTRFKYDEGN